MPRSGTFDYVTIVPDRPEGNSSPWELRLNVPVVKTGDPMLDFRLVGLSPRLQITDISPSSIPESAPGVQQLAIMRSRFTLTASPKREMASVSAASFYVDRGLASVLRPGDALHMARTACGGLGVSVIRDGELVVAVGAVTAVPLGNSLEVHTPFDLVKEAEAVFRRRDPEFEFSELPLEFRVGNRRGIRCRGWRKLGQYEVSIVHGFQPGVPGLDECLALMVVGACSRAAVHSSAQLLDGGRLEVVGW